MNRTHLFIERFC